MGIRTLPFLAITIGFTLLTSNEAVAYYAQPFGWHSIGSAALSHQVDSATYRKLQPPSDEDLYKFVLVDFEKRIPSEFRVPKPLEKAFAFWLKVYTAYTTHHVVIFDQENPEIVYDVLDFRDLLASSRNRVAYEIMRERSIKKRLAEIQRAFHFVRNGRTPKGADSFLKGDVDKIRSMRKFHAKLGTVKEMASRVHTQTGQRDNIVRGLTIGDTYFSYMEKIFEEMGLPSEISRLCLVESSFNYEAVSKVGAAGVWQFMERSAREYMTVNSAQGIDERLSPFKSTVAAAKLLKRNLRSLGVYSLAITAYNTGTRPLINFPDRLNEDQKIELAKEKLGWAGRNFYPAFLAVLHAEKYRDHFYGRFRAPALKDVAFIRIKEKSSLRDFSKKFGLDSKKMRGLNPDILDDSKQLPKGFWMTVPSDFSEEFSVEPHDWIQAQLNLRTDHVDNARRGNL